ncbi:MAG: tryptophan synthase subunit alpha [Fibrobacterota bacterium]
MNRYINTFSSVKQQNRIAFIPFAVAGDPDPDLSRRILQTYLDAGADILEIGYPFSDPMADGPVNQRAAQRAIAAGLNHKSFFEMIASLRANTETPFGLLLYANSIYHLGIDDFCRRAADAGIDSLLVADMPPEESNDLLQSMDRHGLKSVFIVSELTDESRTRYICQNTTGFIYVVSRLGTTGVKQQFSLTVNDTIERLRSCTHLPLCVGFGISSSDHVKAVKQSGADGAIVGSKLVGIIEQYRNNQDEMLGKLHDSISEFVSATR